MLLVDAEGEVETAAGEDDGCGCEENEGMLAVGGQSGVFRMLEVAGDVQLGLHRLVWSDHCS